MKIATGVARSGQQPGADETRPCPRRKGRIRCCKKGTGQKMTCPLIIIHPITQRSIKRTPHGKFSPILPAAGSVPAVWSKIAPAPPVSPARWAGISRRTRPSPRFPPPMPPPQHTDLLAPCPGRGPVQIGPAPPAAGRSPIRRPSWPALPASAQPQAGGCCPGKRRTSPAPAAAWRPARARCPP